MADDFVTKALADSHKLMDKFNNESNVSPTKSPFAPKPTTPFNAPKHEYSDAPYKMAHKPASGIADEAASAGAGIKARMETEAKATQ